MLLNLLFILHLEDRCKLQELEKKKDSESNDPVRSKNEDFSEEEKEEEEKEEEEKEDDIFKNPHPTPALADSDDFVCPFSLMSIKELEKLKVDGLFDKPFSEFKKYVISPFTPFKRENGFQQHPRPILFKKPEDEEVKKLIETKTDTEVSQKTVTILITKFISI